LLCRFSLPWPNLLKCLCPQNSSFLLNFVGAKMSSFCCIVFLFIIVAMCWLLSSLFLFFYHFFLVVMQMFFTIETCAFFSLMYTSEDHDDQSYSSSPILVFNQLFFCVVFRWCMHFVQHSLSLLHFVQCTYLVSFPLKFFFQWNKKGY